VGCAALVVAADNRSCQIGGHHLATGDMLTLDGDAGAVYAGKLDVVAERPVREVEQLKAWRCAVAAAPVSAPIATPVAALSAG